MTLLIFRCYFATVVVDAATGLSEKPQLLARGELPGRHFRFIPVPLRLEIPRRNFHAPSGFGIRTLEVPSRTTEQTLSVFSHSSAIIVWEEVNPDSLSSTFTLLFGQPSRSRSPTTSANKNGRDWRKKKWSHTGNHGSCQASPSQR